MRFPAMLVSMLILSTTVQAQDDSTLTISCIAVDDMLRGALGTEYYKIDLTNNRITLDNGVEFEITAKDDSYIQAQRIDDSGAFKISLDRRTLEMESSYRGETYTYECEVAAARKL